MLCDALMDHFGDGASASSEVSVILTSVPENKYHNSSNFDGMGR